MTSIRLQALDNSSNPIFTVDPTGGTRILSTDDSTGPTIGALTVYGGLGVSKSIYISNTLNATSISTENIICPNATISTLVMSTVTGGSISVTDNVVSNEGQVRGIFTVGNTGNRLRITTSATGTFIQSGQTAGGTSAPILFTDIFATSNWMSILTSGNIGIGGNTSPSFKLDVIGTGRIPTFISTDITAATITLTTGITSTTALLTIATIPNLITTNITSSTLNLTTGITSASALLTIATIPNLITTNVTTSTLNVTTGITSASALLTIATIPNLTSTNITTGTLNITTGITSASALLTIATIPNLITTDITAATITLTTGITSQSALLTIATIPNLITTNISSSTLLVASRNPASVASFRSVSASTSATVALIELQRDPSSGGDALYGDGSTSNVRCKSSIRLINRTFSTPKQNDAITFNADGIGAAFNLDLNYGFVSILDTRESTGITNGSMVVNGGMAVAKTIYSTNVNTTTFTSGNAFFTTGITSASALLTTATIPNLITTNITSSTLNLTTGITAGTGRFTSITGGTGFFTTGITTGNLTVNTVDSTPTIGDIYKQVSFSGANSQAAAANVIGLTFTNANTRGFKVFVTVVVLATSSLYAFYELDGIQRGADWQMSSARTGDDPIVVFSITTSGQVQYTSSTYAGFTSLTFKFRALTIST